MAGIFKPRSLCIHHCVNILTSGISITCRSCWENSSNLHCYFNLKWFTLQAPFFIIIIIPPAAAAPWLIPTVYLIPGVCISLPVRVQAGWVSVRRIGAAQESPRSVLSPHSNCCGQRRAGEMQHFGTGPGRRKAAGKSPQALLTQTFNRPSTFFFQIRHNEWGF